MRKHTKFITVLLSAILAVCLMQTVFVQAFATENTATSDEDTKNLKPVSMEIVKAPETVELFYDEITDKDFWSNVVVHIVYSNGEEYDVNCDGIDSENGIVPPIAEINGYEGNIFVNYSYDSEKNTLDFYMHYHYANNYHDDFISTHYSVKKMCPVSMEIVKAPESVGVNNDEVADKDFWSNVVVHIVYSNGEEYDVNCDGIDSENGITPPIAEIGGYAGYITGYYSDYDGSSDICVVYHYDDDGLDNIVADCPVKKIDMRPVSMKVAKAPKSVTMLRNQISDSSFWSNVVLHIVYSNGEEYDVNCGGFANSDDIVAPIAEIDGYEGSISYNMQENFENNTVDFYFEYRYGNCVYTEGVEDNTIDTRFSVERKDDPHAIVKCEVTKLPDKVFTAPLFTAKDESYDWESLDVNNSISNNIDGMEITYYYANGEKGGTVTFNSSMQEGYVTPIFVWYGTQDLDEYGNYLRIEVRDEGNYKFMVDFLDYPNIDHQTLTAKSSANPNQPINGGSTIDTPVKQSDNNSSATSDVATKDNANNNRTNGTANNGVVATGNFATPAIIATVMILAAAVMFVLKRKHTF